MKDTTAMAGEWWFQGHEMLDLSIYLSIHPSIYLTYPKFSMPNIKAALFRHPSILPKIPHNPDPPCHTNQPPNTVVSAGRPTHRKGRRLSAERFIEGTLSLGIQSYSQIMIGVFNPLLSIVFSFHYHSQEVSQDP